MPARECDRQVMVWRGVNGPSCQILQWIRSVDAGGANVASEWIVQNGHVGQRGARQEDDDIKEADHNHVDMDTGVRYRMGKARTMCERRRGPSESRPQGRSVDRLMEQATSNLAAR